MKQFHLILSLFLITLSFNVNAQNWREVSRLMPSDNQAGDRLAWDVAIDSNYAIVGAPDHTYNFTFGESGAAYVFENNGNNWTEVQKLAPSDTFHNYFFGSSISISGNFAIIGSRGNGFDEFGQNYLNDAGAAYIFENIGGVWTEVQKLVANDRQQEHYFGYSVAISGDYAIIGTPFDSTFGAAYIFERNGNSWNQVNKVYPLDVQSGDEFGFSVSISGDNAVVGARFADSITSNSSIYNDIGAAYIYERIGNNWTQTQKLKATDTRATQSFGWDVSISNKRLIIGAPFDSRDQNGNNPVFQAGSAYIFENISNVWIPTGKVVSNDRSAEDKFGFSVSISNNFATVGVMHEDEDTSSANYIESSGAAYIFGKINNEWIEIQKLVSSDRGFRDYFGNSVGISGQNAIVGCFNDDLDSLYPLPMTNAGSAFIFNTTSVLSSNHPFNNFGISLYPNPSHDKIYIKGFRNKIDYLELTNTDGKIHKVENQYNDQLGVSVESLPNGLYFLKIRSKNGYWISKFIKD